MLLKKAQFFKAVDNLKTIQGVQKFEVLKRIDKNNNAEYAIFMEFENADIYQHYSQHPVHIDFLQNYWFKFVEEFKEMDFESI